MAEKLPEHPQHTGSTSDDAVVTAVTESRLTDADHARSRGRHR